MNLPMTLIHSEGLRMYGERCQALMPDNVREGPWIDESDWVASNVPLETIIEVRRQVAEDLKALNDAMCQEGVTTEHPLEDPLWTVIQILGRGLPDDWEQRALGG